MMNQSDSIHAILLARLFVKVSLSMNTLAYLNNLLSFSHFYSYMLSQVGNYFELDNDDMWLLKCCLHKD